MQYCYNPRAITPLFITPVVWKTGEALVRGCYGGVPLAWLNLTVVFGNLCKTMVTEW